MNLCMNLSFIWKTFTAFGRRKWPFIIGKNQQIRAWIIQNSVNNCSLDNNAQFTCWPWSISAQTSKEDSQNSKREVQETSLKQDLVTHSSFKPWCSTLICMRWIKMARLVICENMLDVWFCRWWQMMSALRACRHQKVTWIPMWRYNFRCMTAQSDSDLMRKKRLAPSGGLKKFDVRSSEVKESAGYRLLRIRALGHNFIKEIYMRVYI